MRTETPTLRPDASLPDLLAARARLASDLRLTLDLVVGVVAALATLVWHPAAWPIVVSAAICFATFGLWGIADRALAFEFAPPPLTERARLAPRRGRVTALRALRAAAAVLGALAGVSLGVSVVALGFGRWIS